MSEKKNKGTDEKKLADLARHSDETLKPFSIEDVMQPAEDLQKTSARREWQIKKFQERFGVSRGIAERMVDEHGASI